jgi:hypothetical protein
MVPINAKQTLAKSIAYNKRWSALEEGLKVTPVNLTSKEQKQTKLGQGLPPQAPPLNAITNIKNDQPELKLRAKLSLDSEQQNSNLNNQIQENNNHHVHHHNHQQQNHPHQKHLHHNYGFKKPINLIYDHHHKLLINENHMNENLLYSKQKNQEAIKLVNTNFDALNLNSNQTKNEISHHHNQYHQNRQLKLNEATNLPTLAGFEYKRPSEAMYLFKFFFILD